MKRLAFLLILLPAMALGQTAEDEQRDRGILQGFLEDKLSSAGRTIRIDGFAGALSSRATLDRLTIADDDGVWLTLENAVLDWNRSAILRGRVEITELTADRLVLPRLPVTNEPPSPEAPGFALPELPVSIDIARLGIDRAEIGAAILGEDAALTLSGSASLASGTGKADLGITRLDGPEGIISIDAAYSNSTRDLALSLDFNEGPGGIAAGLLDLPGEPAVEFVVTGDGTLDDFTAEMLLATDGITRIDGTVSYGTLAAADGGDPDTRFGADISGDIAPLLTPAYQDFFGDSIALDVAGIRRADGRLELERLALDTRALVLEGEVRLDAAGWPQIIDVAGRIAPRVGEGEVLLPLTGPKTHVRAVDLDISYDAAAGEAWSASAQVTGLRRADLSVDRAALSGSGTIEHGTGNRIGRVTGGLDLDVAGIAPAEAALAAAIGDALTGTLRFDYAEDAPLRLTELALRGSDYALTGRADIGGLRDDFNLAVTGDVGLEARDLSRFAALAGADLSGAADLTIDGRIEPLAGAFDLTLGGSATDLGIGQDALDGLIGGDSTLGGRVVRDTAGLRIEDLRVATPATTLTATGDLASGDSEARFTVAVADTGAVAEGLSGPARLTGTAQQTGDDWTFAMSLTAPGDVSAQIDAFLSMPDGRAETVNGIAEITAGSLAPYSALAGRDLGGALDITLAGSGRIPAQTFEASVTGAATDLALGIDAVDTLMRGRSSLSLNLARGTDGRIAFSDARFSNPQLNADLSGSIGLAGGEVTLDARLHDIAPLVPDLSGPATLSGTLTQGDGDLRLVADFSAPGETGGRVDATLALPDGEIGAVSGTARLRVGALAPYSALAGRTLDGALDVAVKASGDPSALTGRAEVSGTARDLVIDIAPVDRLLAGRTELDIAAARDSGGVLRFERAKLLSPQATLGATGFIGPADGRIAFDAALTDLSATAPGVTGAATMQGVLTRTGDDLRLNAGFSGPGEAGGSLDAALAIPGGVPGAASLRADIAVASLAPYAALAGRQIGGGITLELDAEGDLTDLTGRVDATATGRDLRAGTEALDRLLAGQSKLALSLRRGSDGQITFDRADFTAPRLSADLTGRVGREGGTAQFDLRLADIGVFGAGISGPASARGSLGSDGSGWRLSAEATGPGGLSARIGGTLAQDFARANLTATGTGRLEIANAFISPNLVAGRADFDLALNGPLAVTSVSGRVTSSGATVTVPALKLNLSGVDAAIRLSGGAAEIDVSGAGSQGGRVSVSGRVGLEPPFDGALVIDVRDAGLVEPGLYETTVNGRITIDGPMTGGARIAGALTLGEVEVRIPSGGGLISGELPGELVHRNEPPSVLRTRARAGLLDAGNGGAAPGRPYALDLTVNAPSQIFVRGRGLDAELGGQLRLTGTTDNVVTSGRFELIRGRLDILGERLVLDEGTIRLEGDFNPYLRLVATTVSGDITIRIVIEGLLSDPDLEITSQPDLPEEEVLARLLFERGIENISALQAVQLAAAVRTLAGGGGGGIVGRLREDFGLDDLDVTTGADGNTAVQAGKYISENIYTGVTVDSTGRSKVDLNLEVSPSITARGSVSSDGDTSLGVFFERDY